MFPSTNEKHVMIEREIAPIVLKRAREFPVLTLIGPRQSGKTTLVRKCFPDYAYVNLEDPETRDLAENDYKRFLSLNPAPVIIDEIQRVPKLASAIQSLVDSNRKKCGQFVLTGSHQPRLRETVTQSLAGRSAFLKLLPLSFSELKSGPRSIDLSEDGLILRGTMPELAMSRVDANVYYKNYIQTYLERDVRQMANIRNTSAFRRFLLLLAGRVGQLLNLDSLSGDVGVSHTKLSEWLDVLEASFIVFRLEPYHANIKKRLVKTPKLYFTETALASCLLGLKTKEQVARDPLRGHLFENLVVSDLVKRSLNVDSEGDLFFFRTSDGTEVDVIRRTSGGFQPIEIKAAMTWSDSLADGIRSYARVMPNPVDPTVIYGGKSHSGKASAINMSNYLDFRW